MARRIYYAALLGIAVAIWGCSRSDKPSGEDTTATMLNSNEPDTALTAPLNDANILALFDGSSHSDSAVSSVAATKGSAEVRDYARRMMRDHHVLREELARIARRSGLTPELPAGEDFAGRAQSLIDVLNATPKGRDFDKAYLDHEIDAHLDMLDIANVSMPASRVAEVKAFIQKAAPTLQSHLDAAQALQRSMM